MSLSKRSIENLLDLVEIKLSAMDVQDRDDARELAHLEACRRELIGLRDSKKRGRTPRRTPKGPELAAQAKKLPNAEIPTTH